MCVQWHAAQGRAEAGAQASVADSLGWPGRETNEPAVIHSSSFGEDKGGGFSSFVLVLTLEGMAEQKHK